MTSAATFWNNDIEPKRSYRWVADINLFPGDGGTLVDYGPRRFLVKSFTKPTFTLDNESLINNFTSETEIIIKNYVWDDISITMIDVENPEYNVSDGIYSWLTSLGYRPNQAAQTDGGESQLSRLFTNLYANRLSIALEHVNADGMSLERWTFNEPQPTSIDFGGEISYDSDEIMTVTMGITYVSAHYEKIDS